MFLCPASYLLPSASSVSLLHYLCVPLQCFASNSFLFHLYYAFFDSFCVFCVPFHCLFRYSFLSSLLRLICFILRLSLLSVKYPLLSSAASYLPPSVSSTSHFILLRQISPSFISSASYLLHSALLSYLHPPVRLRRYHVI